MKIALFAGVPISRYGSRGYPGYPDTGADFPDAKLQLSVAPAVLDKQHKEADNNVRSLNYLTKGLNAKHFEEMKSANFLHTSLNSVIQLVRSWLKKCIEIVG